MDPLVSIVTPCLNGARYLEAAIESVLRQDYPNVEYIVMDGGSTDGTLDLLKQYGSGIEWVSEKDRGTADAINKGFARSSGSIFAYLHADDLLLPGAVAAAVETLESFPDAAGVYGDAWWIDEQGVRIARYPVKDFLPRQFESECFICQPASFVRRDVFLNLGLLDATLKLTFDYEFWMRLARVYPMKRIDRALACSRMHSANKSLGQKQAVFEETFQVLRRHYGYIPFHWVYGFLCNSADGRDQFFEPLQPSLLRYIESLPKGLALNYNAPGRYLLEWFRVMSWSGLRRRLHPSSNGDM